MAEKQLRILQINSVYDYASTGRIVKKLHTELIAEGFYSSVIYSRSGAIGNGMPTGTISEPDVYRIVHPIEQKADIIASVLFDTNGLHSKNNTQEIIQKILEIQPDLIHLHNIHGFYLNVPILFQFLKDYQRPVLWTLHDCWSYTGFCAYYDYHQCSRWQTGCQKCPFRDTYPYRILSHSKENYQWKKEAYKGLDIHLAVPSAWLKGELSKSILGDKPCRVIHNSIDSGQFYYEKSDLRHERGLEGKRVYFACAGVWTKPKGLGELCRLADLLTDQEELVIAGLSEKQKRMFQGNVLSLGMLDAQALRRWYSTADCFVNLSLEDNYPTVNLEARACGLPVVTYRTGGSPESAALPNLVAERHQIDSVVRLLRQYDRNNVDVPSVEGDMSAEYMKYYREILD